MKYTLLALSLLVSAPALAVPPTKTLTSPEDFVALETRPL